MTRYFLVLASLASLLPGCVDKRARIPSLLPREVEQRDDLEPVRTAPIALPDAALDATIAKDTQQLATNIRAFDETAAKARALVDSAHDADIGSDSWLDAQKALGAVDVAHSAVTTMMADLDRIAIDRAGANMPDYPALAALREAVQARADVEAQTIAQLHGQLKSE